MESILLKSDYLKSWIIFILGVILFTINLSTQEVIGFESRFYLFALEMWRHGITWFPTTYQEPYPDYPATSTVLIYLCAKLFGNLNKTIAIFPSALASAVTLAVTYLIGARQNWRWGLGAVLFLFFTLSFVEQSRTISLDQYTTAITAVCFYLCVINKSRWIFPLLIVGFAFRGPLGLIIPTAVVCIYFLLEKDFKKFLIIGLIATIILAFCSALLLFISYHEGGLNFLRDVLRMELFGRLQKDSQTPPFYFYFKECLGAYALSYPVFILVLLGLIFKAPSKSADKELLVKLIGWVAIILIGMSIPADKKIRYILPLTPPLALICGYLFTVTQNQRYFYRIKQLFLGFCFIFPLFAAVVVFFLKKIHPEFSISYKLFFLYLMLQICILFFLRKELIVASLAAFTFLSAIIFISEPINLKLNQTKEFVRQVENFRQTNNAQLVFYRFGKDGLVIKYLVNTLQEAQPIFVKEIKDRNNVIISTLENFSQIQNKNDFKIQFQGKLGRDKVVVFTNKEFA